VQRLAAMTLPQQGGAQQQEQSAAAAGQRMSTWDGAPPLPTFVVLCAATACLCCPTFPIPNKPDPEAVRQAAKSGTPARPEPPPPPPARASLTPEPLPPPLPAGFNATQEELMIKDECILVDEADIVTGHANKYKSHR
jgi:hypothetical protein